MEGTAITCSQWLVFNQNGEYQFIHILTHNEPAHYKEIYEFELDLRSKGLYAHELQHLHQPYLRGQKLVDKLCILGWDFDSNGVIVDKGHSLLSKGRIFLDPNKIDSAMSFLFHLWAEDKTDQTLLDHTRTVLLALQRAKARVSYRNSKRQQICERARKFKATHKDLIASYKSLNSQKHAINKKRKM